MSARRKITRIFTKTLKYLFVLLVLLCVFAVIAVNSEKCQTWLAHKAANYLSKELGSKVEIGKLKIHFIRTLELEDVFVEGTEHDTLLFSRSLSVKINDFNFQKKYFKISEVKVTKTSIGLLRYRTNEAFNFAHIIKYFASPDSAAAEPSLWKISYGDLILDDVNFYYKDLRKDTAVSQNINFNNISARHIKGKVTDIRIMKDSVFAWVKDLSATEQCGLRINNLTTIVKVSSTLLECKGLHLETVNSDVRGGFSFRYSDWEDYQDFMNKVKMNVLLLSGTKLNFKDLAYFAKELNGFENEMYVHGKVSGYVSDMTGKGMSVEFAKNTRFLGDLYMKGLPDVNSTFMKFDVQQFSTSRADLEKVQSYPFTEKKHLKLPVELAQLGVVNFKGKFEGYTTDFFTNGKFRTALGSLTTNLGVKIDTARDVVSYEGKLQTDNFNVGKLLAVPKLGSVALNSRIKGKGLTLSKADATLDGKINSITYNNYAYQDITLNGNIKKEIFKGTFVMKDNNADLDFDGSVDFSQKVPVIDFISTINKIYFKRLNLIDTKTDGVLSSQVLINLKGNSIDNLSGKINFDNTIYKTEEKEHKISTFDLTLEQSTPVKDIVLNSNILNLTVNGPFKISNMDEALKQFLHAYYPAFFSKPKSKLIYTDNFKYKITIKKFNTLRDLFVHDLMVSPGSVFEGEFDASKNLLGLNSTSDSIKYKNIKFYNGKIESYSKNNKINLVFKSDYIDLTDSIRIYNFFSYFVSQDKNTKYNFEWDNKIQPKNAGKFAGKITFDNRMAIFTYDKMFITTQDSTWNMVTSDSTIIDSSGTIRVKPLVFVNNDQMVSVYGGLSNKPGEKLVFDIKNFSLRELSPLFGSKLQIQGYLNGTLTLHNSIKNLAFSSNLKFDKVKINGKDLGEGELVSEYNNTDKYLFLDGYTSLGFTNMAGEKIKNISFSGYYYLEKKEESLDIALKAEPANLTLLNPILKGILTFNKGLVTGSGKITGTPAKPKIDGNFKIYTCELKVDYLNVVYSLTGNIEIYPDQIAFREVKISDDLVKKTPMGEINGNIFHDNFQNMRLDYDINFKNMMVLNKPNNGKDPFYGKAYATGNAGIYGFLNNVAMEINVKTEKGTVFTIPLDAPAEVSDKNFIRFVKKDTLKKKEEERRSGFTLDMDVHATPDAEVQIVLDAKSGDIIRARGKGDIDLNISNMGKFDMYGEYVINSGDYLFTLENVITKKFEIEKGSTINWSGSPYNAEIDITANYKQRASIAPLFPYDTTGVYKRRVPVDCKLMMNDKLTSPNISFGIDLPTLDENTASKIQSVLNDEAELNRQVFSLLLLKSFVTPLQYSSGGGISAGSAIAANSTEMLSNRISGWLSGLTKEVDIGVNYRPGNEVSSDELDIALSKQLLNNRLIVESNVGFNNNQNTSSSGQNTNSTGLIGDVNVEYKLTEDGRYRVKGFNRSNDNTDQATTGGAFTQGVGVFYREEYEQWRDLYRKYISKIKKSEKNKDKQVEVTVEDKPEENFELKKEETRPK
jgi:hypothetical protein